MRTFILVFLVFAAGLGVGFYLWGTDNVTFISQEMKNLVERTPAQQPVREDTKKKPLTAAEITSGIVGTWKSVDDQTFTRTFSVDASVTDRYEGDEAATTEGRWAVFTAPAGEPPPFPVSPGTIYLRLSFTEEALYFSVRELSPTHLDLFSMQGLESASFVRQQ